MLLDVYSFLISVCMLTEVDTEKASASISKTQNRIHAHMHTKKVHAGVDPGGEMY